MSIKPSKKVELLAPAGNFEKLEIVLHYGADAVYMAGKMFSLRNFSGNFNLQEMRDAVDMVHQHGAKAYIAVNIFARNEDLEPLNDYIAHLSEIEPDGIIVADPAILTIVRQIAPQMPIHLSTQANTTNAESVRFWHRAGVARINAARELSLNEIADLSAVGETEIEAFVHGAMCMSYSGRCLLSNYMANRPSNQGMCCQPCRFQYAVVEQTRPGQYFPLIEDNRGTYIFNSKDLCMLANLPAMIEAGIGALKIEGRMKGIHYAATAVKVYREAINRYYEDPGRFNLAPYWQTELDKITSRGYCTGFYLDDPQQTQPNYNRPQPPIYALAAKVLSVVGPRKAQIEVRNQLRYGDTVEILSPSGPPKPDRIGQMFDADGQQINTANPGDRIHVELDTGVHRLDLLRLKVRTAK